MRGAAGPRRSAPVARRGRLTTGQPVRCQPAWPAGQPVASPDSGKLEGYVNLPSLLLPQCHAALQGPVTAGLLKSLPTGVLSRDHLLHPLFHHTPPSHAFPGSSKLKRIYKPFLIFWSVTPAAGHGPVTAGLLVFSRRRLVMCPFRTPKLPLLLTLLQIAAN